ncbi:MAG: sulfur carrier protein ThiS [Mailhella sp.]|nr:sulfur carrier protein ThiS [Mailhella sp.]
MNITVNGESRELDSPCTLLEYLQSQGIDPDAVVAELDLVIIPRENFGSVRLVQGVSLEILHFVGGG